jgi:hypothetical protein
VAVSAIVVDLEEVAVDLVVVVVDVIKSKLTSYYSI